MHYKQTVTRWIHLHPRRTQLLLIVIGALLAVIVLGFIRFTLDKDKAVHYHANFAVFIDGQREQFKGPQYYQEVSACDEHSSPLGRVHLHDENNHLVHVHDAVVTWGDLFTNLGWSLNNTMLFDGKTAYIDGQGGYVSFVLNGQSTKSIANEVIKDQDRLLISFGAADQATLMDQFSQVQGDAKQADTTADPANCQGPEHHSIWLRLRQAFFF